MPEALRRPFTLADAMILVAATTPAMVLLRLAADTGLFKHDPRQKLPPGRLLIGDIDFVGACVLLSLTLAVLIITLRRPWPTLRDAVGGPGFVACLTVMVAMVLPLTRFAVAMVTSHGLAVNLISPFYNVFAGLAGSAGEMIVGAWLALALVGRWRLKSSWTDCLGCLIGVCWVIQYSIIHLYFIGVLPLVFGWTPK